MDINSIMNSLEVKHPGEKEYLQAVKEVLMCVEEVYNQHPEFEKAKIVERMVEPDRIVTFRVTWTDDRGEVQIMARVTSRIMPGVVGMPHAHRREIVDGVDIGANANTLSGHHWSPISKNCPSTGSTLVQVEKA